MAELRYGAHRVSSRPRQAIAHHEHGVWLDLLDLGGEMWSQLPCAPLGETVPPLLDAAPPGEAKVTYLHVLDVGRREFGSEHAHLEGSGDGEREKERGRELKNHRGASL